MESALESGMFDTIHTIEINQPLYEKAVDLFKNNPQVICHFGDSVEIIPKLVDTYQDEEVTFWLSAHASGPLEGGKTGPSALIEELKAIAGINLLVLRNGQMVHVRPKINKHTIFIDDRRLFGTPECGNVNEAQVLDIIGYVNSEYHVTALDGHIPHDVICASRRDGSDWVPPAPKALMDMSIEGVLNQRIDGQPVEEVPAVIECFDLSQEPTANG